LVTRFFATVASADFINLKTMQFSSFVVTRIYRASSLSPTIFSKVKALTFIIGKGNTDKLESIVNCVMSLKAEKTGWTAHGAD